jgi:hypothetical protein
MDTPDFRLSVWREALDDIYSFNQPVTSSSQTRPLQTISRIRHPMPYTATPRDTEGGCYEGNSLPQSEATPRPYAPELDHANPPPPPCCIPAVSILRHIEFCPECDDTIFEAALSVHNSSYSPQWNAAMHSSVQDQRYGAPMAYVNDMVCGYGVWSDARQRPPFAPANATASIDPS